MIEPAKESLDLGILVSDINASLKFYQDILGLKFIEKIPVWFGTMYRLRFGTSDFKLIAPRTLPPKGTGWIGGSNRCSLHHLCNQKPLSDLCEAPGEGLCL